MREKEEMELKAVLEGLKGERHPQKYLKKVVIFYREASKHCSNVD